MSGPYLPVGFDSGLEELLCGSSILYGSEMTAFSFEDDSILWDECSPHESVSSGGAKLQSHHASAGGSSRSPTGSSLIITPTSTQLDFQDVDGFLEAYMDETSTSPDSNTNHSTSAEDFVHVHSFDVAPNGGNQRVSSRPARIYRTVPGPLFALESPHAHNVSMIPSQRGQPSSIHAYSDDMYSDPTQRRFPSGVEMEPYQRTNSLHLSESSDFEATYTTPSYLGEGLPFRTVPNSDVLRTSFENMATMSQQTTHLPANTHNMIGHMDNGFAHYHSSGVSFAAPALQQYRAGLPTRDAAYMQYLQMMSQNGTLPHSGPHVPIVTRPQHLANNRTGMYAADEMYQQQEVQAAVDSKPARLTHVHYPDADVLHAQAVHSLSKRSTVQSASSRRSGGLTAHDNADRVRKGGRIKNSKLSDKSREQSSSMRKLGACWRCAMQRDSCDHGDPCARCIMRPQRGQSYFFPCDRSKLPDFVHEFLPPSMTIMHQKQTIEDSVASSVLDWDLDNGIDIYLSSGYGPPLLWKVHEFRPRSEEYLSQLQYHQDNDRDKMVRTVNYSPPYGLLKIEPTEEAHLDTYLDRLLEQRFLWEFGWTFYEAETLTDDFQAGVLDLMCKLYINTTDEVLESLLKDILRMLLITYIMGHTLTISEETVPTVIANIRHSPTPSHYTQKYTSPRLANRQLKFFFAVLRNGIYEKLLKWQQQTLHTAGRKEQTWLQAFCVTLGFAMVLEEVQHTLYIQADASVARSDMNRKAADQQASNACERIDTRFKLLVGLFQCKYRDKKWGDNGSFGPGTPQVKDPASRMFLAELRETLAERRDHLQSRENVTFCQENQCYFTSRLTAKFLVPFLDLPG